MKAIAPWKDNNGNLLFEGDFIQERGKTAKILFLSPYYDETDQWRASYTGKGNFDRLCLLCSVDSSSR